MRSKVKWFDKTKGFGFIVNDEGDRDYYLNASKVSEDTIEELLPGVEVEIEVSETRLGPQVKAIKIIRDDENEE